MRWPPPALHSSAGPAAGRPGLGQRLQDRRAEIEQAVLARVYSISDPAEVGDPEYVAGLRAAVGAAIDHGLSGLERTDDPGTSVPPALLAQARQAARNDVSLDTVLRRYFAGYTLLGEFVAQEAEAGGPAVAEEAQRLTRSQAALFDRLVAAVTEAHRSETETRLRTVEQGRADRVKRLLAGELVDDAELGYELGGRWHIGAIATGPGAPQALRSLAASLDRRLLLVRPGRGAVWAWLGGRRRIPGCEVASVASASWPEETVLAIGDPSHGIGGWRLTHRQALAALPVAQREDRRAVAYGDVSLLASALSDELLSASLAEIYLAPLALGHDRGATLRETLRAYFAAGRNVSSAAVRLGVSRKTVSARLRSIEARIGRQLDSCTAEMETALRLDDLSDGRIQ